MANIAVVGAGYWGKNLVRDFFELGALKAICDKQRGLHAQYKEKYPGITFTNDFQSLLNDQDMDALVITTPAQDPLLPGSGGTPQLFLYPLKIHQYPHTSGGRG